MFFRKASNQGNDRKARQLCKQVYRTLSCTLAGQFGDALLQDLSVESVEPAPDASRLLVTVRLVTLWDRIGPEQVLGALKRVRGVLRQEVAAAICRRRAPELTYRVIGPREVNP